MKRPVELLEGLPAAQRARLGSFARLLEERAVPTGLVAESDRGRIMERHVLDCLRAAPLIGAGDRLIYDLGSGAGLPGIVLAIVHPDPRFVLVESRARKAAFLDLAIERLGLENVEPAVQRVEALSGPADAATARAFAPLERSWRLACPLLRPGGRLIYFAGQGLRDPLGAASSLREPEPPATVEIAQGLATGSPLVIMARG